MSRDLILVTGGAGFIGSNIVAELAGADQVDIAVCDRLRAAESGKWRNISKYDIADFVAPEAMFDWLDRHESVLKAVVHMGAISSTTEPDADLIIHNNFTLSKALWDWCAAHGKRLVYASSAATYGDGEQGFADDDDYASLKTLRPLNAYGWSKSLFDLYARREAAKGHAPAGWAGLKFFNVYGPNEYHKGSMKSVVAQVYPKIAAGQGVQLFRSHRPDYRDGGQLRDFVYVKDAARVAAWLTGVKAVEGVYNLGTGQARSFLDLAHATFAAAGRTPDVSFIDTPEVIRDKYQYFTEARMQRLSALGYNQPFFSLEDGVKDYVEQYLSRPDPYR
jgi:ADP-L-glycero-D-manno-heptose 6-epimerase